MRKAADVITLFLLAGLAVFAVLGYDHPAAHWLLTVPAVAIIWGLVIAGIAAGLLFIAGWIRRR